MLDVKCIVAIVERGRAEKIVKEAKKSGSGGATIFYGRGTGESEVKKFLNVHIEASKEIILMLAEEERVDGILDTIVKVGDLKKPGTGIVFTLSVDQLVGLRHRADFKH